MTLSKRVKTIIFVLFFLIASGAVFGILHSLYYESPPAYRPIFYYNGSIFTSSNPFPADIDTDSLEYIGMINSDVPNNQIPKNDFECNGTGWIGRRIFKDKKETYYLEVNGNMFILDKKSLSPYPETRVYVTQ